MKRLKLFVVLLVALLSPMALVAQSLPYSETFESWSTGTGNLPTNWALVGGDVHVTSGTYYHGGSKYLYFNGSGTNTVALPVFSLPASGLKMSFWETPEGTSYSGVLNVGYITDVTDVSTFVTVMTIDCQDRSAKDYTNGYHELTFESAPMGARIAFQQVANSYWYWFVDDVTVERLPDCQTPENLYTSGLTQTSVDLNWSIPGVGAYGDVPTKYQLKVTDAAGNVVINNQALVVSSNYYQITGLTANTTYTVELTGDCQDNYHDLSNTATLTFTTMDNAISLPYYENFDGLTALPTSYNMSATLQSSTKYGSSGKAVQLTPSSAQQAYMIFPLMNVSADDIEMSVMMRRSGSAATRFQIGYLTDPSDIASTFVPMMLDSLTAGDWTEYRFNTAASGDPSTPVMMMILVDNGQTSSVYVDEVSIHNIPTCTRPEHLTVTNYTAHTATLDWDMTNASNVLVRIMNMSDSTVTTQMASAHPYVVTGLDDRTSYQFTIQGVCSATDSSEVTRPVSCTTLCDLADSPLFVEGFENVGTNGIPECWLTGWFYKGSSAASAPFRSNTSYKHGGSNAMTLVYQANGTISYLSTQGFTIDQAGKYTLSVWVYRQSASSYMNEGITFWVCPNPTDTTGGVKLGEVHRHYGASPVETATGWYRYDYTIPVSGTQYIVVVGRSQYGSATYFDDLEVKLTPTCQRVSNISFNNLTSSSYDMAWTAGGSETQWLVDYQLKQGNTVIADTAVVVSQPSFSFAGLTSNTSYTATGEVRAICAEGDTAEAMSFSTGSFTTLCGLMTEVPQTWGFETAELTADGGSYRLPSCWARINDATDSYSSSYPYSYETSYSHSGSRALYFYGSTSSSYANKMFAIMPGVDPTLPINTLRLKFFARLGSSGTQYLVVGVMNDPADTTTFVPVDTVVITDVNHSQFVAAFDTYTGSGVYPAIYYPRPSASGAIYVDDLTIEAIPSCVDLEGSLTMSDVTASTIRVAINDATATDWRLAYAEGDGEFTTIDIHGAQDTLLSGLAEATTYTFKACRLCGTEVSPWTENVTATTTAVPATMPYVCGFEDDTENGRWQFVYSGTNHFVVGTSATGVYDDAAGLYVSNNGTAHSYATGNASNAFAYRTIHFDSKGYQVEFKWKANGESASYDFGKAVLCRTSKSLDPTTSGYYYSTAAITDTVATFEPMASGGAFVLNKATIAPGTTASDWQTVSHFLDMTGKAGDYNLVFQWCNDGSVGNQPPLAIDNISITELTCIPPKADAMIISGLTSTGATLTITSSDVTEWDVLIDTVMIDAENIPAQPFYHQDITTNSITLSNLTPNTEYYYAVRSVCGADDMSDWSTVGHFHTFCSAMNVPYSETFENVSSTNCWTMMDDGTATGSVARNTSYRYQGNASMMINNATVVSPEFVVDSLTHYMITGWAYCTQDSAILGLGVMTDPNEVSTFEPVGEGTIIPKRNTWTEFTAYFTDLNAENYPDEDYDSPAENPRYAKNIVLISSDKTVYIDNLIVDLTPECPKPTEPVISNITAHSFDLSFLANGTETSWVVYVNGNPQIITSNPATITGLAASTNYNVEIAAICGAGDTSYTTVCGSLRTLCDAMELPYTCGFETSDGFTANGSYSAGAIAAGCWSELNALAGGTYPYYIIGTDGTYIASGNQSVKFYSSSSAYVYLVMPVFTTPISQTTVKFKAKFESSSSSGYIELGYMTDPSDETTWTTVYTANRTTSFAEYEAAMTGAPAGARIAFRYGGGTSNNYYAGLDDIQVKEIRNCSDPNAPVVSNIGSATADVAFTDTCAAHSTWEYVYGPSAGFSANSLTPVTLSDTTAFSLTGLTDDTQYTVAVRAVCGAGDESNWITTQFHTTCLPIVITETAPYSESFEDAVSGAFYDNVCYETYGNYSTTYSKYGVLGEKNSTSTYSEYYYAKSGQGCLKPYVYPSYTPNGVAFMRQFHLEAGKVYKTRAYVANPSSSGTLTTHIYYGATSDVSNMTFVESIEVPYIAYDYEYTTISVYHYEDCYVPVEGYISVETTGDYYICYKFNNTYTGGASCYVDDFSVEETDACFPAGVTVYDATENTAMLTMADADATAEYEYYVLDANNDTVVATTTFHGPTTTITGLAGSSSYTAYVRRVCGDGVYADWRSTSFRTACGATPLPYVCGFETTDGFIGTSSYTEGSLEAGCWNVLNDSSSYPAYFIENSSYNALIGQQSLKLISGSSSNPLYCIMPAFDTPLNTCEIHFTSKREGASSGYLSLGYFTDPTDASTWVQLVACSESTDPEYQEYALTSYSIPANARLAFRYGNWSSSNWYYWIDGITVMVAPSCRAPRTAPTVSSTTMTTMNVNVDMDGKALAEVGCAVKTTTTTAANIDPNSLVQTTTGSATLTGLTGSTNYAVYYRYICAEGDTSDWSPMGQGATTASDCFEPQNLRIVGILNDHHVDILWGKAPEAVSYEWELKHGSTVVASDNTAAALIDTMSFDTLTATTSYTFRVRTICTSDTSVWKTISFTTTVPTYSLPFVCDFEDATINGSWAMSSSSVNNFTIGSGVNNGGSNALYVSDGTGDYYYLTSSSSNAYAQVLVELPAGSAMVSFDWRSNGESNYDYGYAYIIPTTTAVEYTSIPTSAITLIESRMQTTASWQSFNKVITVPSAGVYALTFTWRNDASMGSAEPIAIDNISIQEVACMPAGAITAASVGSSNAKIVVSNTNATDFEWAVSTVDDADALTDLTLVSTTNLNDTVAVTGLQLNTQYYFFVRNVCDETHKSPFVRLAFRTTSVAAEIPYVCSFEAGENINSWSLDNSGVNYFVIGSADASAGSNSLYVTTDGYSAGYTNNGVCYAYMPVSFGPGVYEISYRWKAVGESTYDYGHAMLLPSSVTPTTDVMLTGMSSSAATSLSGAIVLNGNYAKLNLETNWVDMFSEVSFTDSVVMNLCFAWRADGSTINVPGLCVDEISIVSQSCMTLQSSEMALDTVSTDMFTISFVNRNEGATTHYVVALDNAFTDTVVAGSVASGVSTFTANNLMGGTVYFVRLYSDCGTDGISKFTDVSVRTSCDTVRVYPYVQDFENLTAMTTGSVQEACFVVNPASTSSQYVTVGEGASYAHTGNKGMYVSNGYYEDFSQTAQLPAMVNLNGKHLSFWHKAYGTDSYYNTLNVGYVANGVFTSLEVLTKSTGWTRYETTLSNIPAGARIAFKFSGEYYYWLDDIRIADVVAGNTYNDTVCYGASYSGHGIQKSYADMQVGDNQFTEVVESTVAGVADSLTTLNIYMRPEARVDSYDTICAGVPYTKDGWNIASPSSSLPYTQRFVSVHGCDSFVTLHLYVIPTTEVINDTICQGDFYEFDGQQLTQSGTYTATITNKYGCTVDQTLYLFVADTATTVTTSICNGESYQFEGQSYTQSGTYTVTTTGMHGCPMTKTLVLTVTPTDSICNVTFCQGGSVQVADTFITTAGSYELFRVNGNCDITYHITATETPAPIGDVYDNACEGYAYNGYGISGLVVTHDTVVTINTRTADALCDSITNVHLTYVATKYGSEHVTINKGETYEWYDNTYSETGEYTETLQSAEGCDSVVTLHLTVVDGLDVVNGVKVDVVPNPVRPGMTAYVYGEFGEVEAVEILNNFGQVVDRFAPSSYPIEVEGLEVEGLYYVRVITRKGEVYTEKLIVK